MTDLSAFPITEKWPAQHPDRLQLYSLPTPNGVKVSIMLEETGQLMPRDAPGRYLTIQWLMFQMSGIGPMFGQVGFFNKFAGKDYEDKRPRDRYVAESKRLLGVLDRRLADRAWIMGETYTIADVATFPWIRNLIGFYEAGDLVGMADFKHVIRALQSFVARPAVVRGLDIPGNSLSAFDAAGG